MAVTPYALVRGQISQCSAPITTTGANAFVFTLPQGYSQGGWTLVLAASGATALPTTCTVDLEASFDGQVTWQKIATAIALVATTIATPKTLLNIPTGVPLRINTTAYTAGSSTGTTVLGVIN